MSKNYHSRGSSITVPAPSGGTVSGNGYLIGSMFGIAGATVDEGDPVVLDVVGCFTIVKATGGALAVGQAAFWDNTAKKITGTAAGNTLVGVAIEAAGSDATSAVVRLNGTFGAASAAELAALALVVDGLGD